MNEIFGGNFRLQSWINWVCLANGSTKEGYAKDIISVGNNNNITGNTDSQVCKNIKHVSKFSNALLKNLGYKYI